MRLAPSWTPALALTLCACGGGVDLTVELATSSAADLDPFQVPNLTTIRVRVDGTERTDDATRALGPGERSVVFEALPGDREVRVQVEGFDSEGNLLAFGRADAVQLDGDVTASVPFRRHLAFVTHKPICDATCRTGEVCADAGEGARCVPEASGCAGCGADQVCVMERRGPTCERAYTGRSKGPGVVYALDVMTRSLVRRIALPGTDPRGRGVTSADGRAMVLTWSDQGQGFVGLLSLDDGSLRALPMPVSQDLAVLGPSGVGAAAGGGRVLIFKEDGSVLADKPAAGRALAGAVGAGGRRAVFAMSASPGVLIVDLEDPAAPLIPPGSIAGATGLGLSEDGRFAYVASAEGEVYVVDLVLGSQQQLGGSLPGAVQLAAYSERASTVVGVQNRPEDNVSRIIAYSVAGLSALDETVGALPRPEGLAAGPGGRRLVVVSVGTTTRTAGLTVLDVDQQDGLDGSTVLYPSDPEDSFPAPGGLGYQTYHPHRVGTIYGR